MTLALIHEYKRFEPSFKDPSVKKKLVWKNIAACLHAQGYSNVTDDACDKKWRNLKKTFKDIYTGQRRKNNGKWAYYDVLEEVFGKDPKIINAVVSEHNTSDILPALSKHPVIHKYKTPDGQNVHVEVVDVGETSHILDGQKTCGLTNVLEYTDDEESPVETTYEEYNEGDTVESGIDQIHEPPPWFAQFLNEYRDNEERRLEMLQNMHDDILALENRKVFLLEQLLNKFDSSTKTISPVSPTYIPSSGTTFKG
ncbi:uncharacterized protein LOC105685991 isoform X2 [Athalia rosae]|nr:uncharacterized protein LOC105685991 isoform X2 [Athalia rosae]